MVLSVCKSKGRAASEADIRVDPFGSDLGVYHGRTGGREVLGWKFVPCGQDFTMTNIDTINYSQHTFLQ